MRATFLRRSKFVLSLVARRVAEWLGLPFLYAALAVVRLYRPSYHQTSHHIYRAADRLGVYPVIDHYHDPQVRFVRRDRGGVRKLPGIDLRVDAQLALLRELRYGVELSAISLLSRGGIEPYYGNPAFAAPDAQVYYSLLRRFRPHRVVEVGSGQSTRFAHRALEVNRSEGALAQLVAIEPYEAPELNLMDARIIRHRVEDLPPGELDSLEPGDVLFIDSSHVVQPGGDVAFLLLTLVPSLSAGVLLHVHDIFTPRDPPVEWSRRRRFWAEQYVLEALLTHNERLEVLLLVDYLSDLYPAEFAAACPIPTPPGVGPTTGSCWLRTCEPRERP